MVLEYQTYFTAKYLREDTIGYLTNFAGLGTSNKYIWTQQFVLPYITNRRNLQPISPPDSFNLNSALSNAARHVANVEGPCGTKGDQNSRYVEDVLKLYAYDWTDLEIVRYESTEIIDEASADFDQPFNAYFINHFIAQESNARIRDIILNGEDYEFGIGCACSNQPSKFRDEINYLCYLVLAKTVVAKEMNERIPAYLSPYDEDGEFMTKPDQCYQ